MTTSNSTLTIRNCETMGKLLLCRICMAENVRMHVVTNGNLHNVYEKLTDVPFVTEDNRPVMACFFCFTKLEKCYHLLRQCLESEEMFAHMLEDGYEQKPFIDQPLEDHLGGYIKTPVEHINISAACQTDDNTINVGEGDKELSSKEKDPVPPDSSFRSQDIVPLQFKYEVPLVSVKTETIDEEQLTEQQRAEITTNQEYLVPLEKKDDVPLVKIKSEKSDKPGTSPRKRTKTGTPIVKKASKRDMVKTTQKDNGQTDLKTSENTAKNESEVKDANNIIIKTEVDITTVKKEEEKPETKSTNEFITTIDTSCRCLSHNGEFNCSLRHKKYKIYQCNLCQRNFNNRSNLKYHLLNHTGEKPHKCDVCQRRFKQKSHLNSHMRSHTGIKPFQCDICDHSFTQKYYLNIHKRTHTGEKPFKCDICQRSFTEKGSLVNHLRKHTGEKPFKCPTCLSSFTRKSSLNIHIRIHTGEKPYKCEICSRSFIQKNVLNSHLRLKHNA